MVQQPVLQTLGSWLAMAYFAYGIFLFSGFVFALHAIVLLFALYVTRRGRWESGRFTRIVLVIEVLYGFVNPLIYLVVLASLPDVPWHPTPPSLTAPAWALIVLVWGARLLGRHPEQDSAGWRRTVQVVLAASLILLGAYLVKDIAGVPLVSGGSGLSGTVNVPAALFAILLVVSWLALYLVPATLLTGHLRANATPGSWAAERRFLLGNFRGVRALLATLMTVAVISVIGAQRWSSDDSVRDLVLARRDRIVAAANEQGVDPRLLAALVYVVQRDTVSALSSSLERLAMGAWLADPKNDVGLAGPLDASIGLTQVKPSTALQAMSLHLSWTEPETWRKWRWDKELRPLPTLGPEWRLDASAVASLVPPLPPPPSKAEVVERLFSDEGSLSIAAFILALYEAQWRSADLAWDISSKPEITATLYQIGFARSHPHADPRANSFGAEVGRVYRSPWIQEHFGGTTDTRPSRPSE